MTYQEFEECIANELEEKLGEEVMINLHNVNKNNGVKLRALTIKTKEENLSPTFYLKEYYEDYSEGDSIERIVDRVMFLWNENRFHNTFALEKFLEYENVKDKVVYKLVNYKANEELLQTIPHEQYLDLALVYYYQIPEEVFSNATTLIRNKDLEMWGITKEIVFEDAKHNTPKVLPFLCQSMADMLQEIIQDVSQTGTGEPSFEEVLEQEPTIPMYVITNVKKYLGAAVMLYPDELKNISNLFLSDLYILPSSIHECILVPTSGEYSKEELSMMVQEINQSQVPIQEVLSDHVYLYSREEEKIMM